MGKSNREQQQKQIQEVQEELQAGGNSEGGADAPPASPVLNLQGQAVSAGDVVYSESLYRHLLVVQEGQELQGQDLQGRKYRLYGVLNNVTAGVEFKKLKKNGGK